MKPITKSAPSGQDPAPAKRKTVWIVSAGDDILKVCSSIRKVATFVDTHTGQELKIVEWELDK